MAIHIVRVSLYAGIQSLDMPLSASRPSPIGTPTDRILCHTFVALSDQWISTSTPFVGTAIERQRTQSTDIHI